MNPIDALVAALDQAGLAGLSAAGTTDCPDFGDALLIGGNTYLWGDSNCDGPINGTDIVNILLAYLGLEVEQIGDCPDLGQPLA